MNAQDFLRRTAARLGRSEPLADAPARAVAGAPEFWLDYRLPEEERVQKFAQELAALGGSAKVCESLADLSQHLRDLLQDLAPECIGTWGGPFVQEYGIADVLQPYRHVAWEPEKKRREEGASLAQAFSTVDVGITGCDYAIADTGTVVLLCDEAKGRSVSLLPSVHVVLVRARQIRTRMGEVLADLALRQQSGQGQPSSVNFISGPSRSSDIENDLSIGVHGPAAVIALVVRS